MFIAALLTIANTWKQPNRQVDTKAIVHRYNGRSLGQERNEILLFVTAWMGLEGITLSKISQSEKDKYHMILLICEI